MVEAGCVKYELELSGRDFLETRGSGKLYAECLKERWFIIITSSQGASPANGKLRPKYVARFFWMTQHAPPACKPPGKMQIKKRQKPAHPLPIPERTFDCLVRP
jgi:hypothetical protein